MSDALQINFRLRRDDDERSVRYLAVYSYVMACMECKCAPSKSVCIRNAMKAIGIDESEYRTVRQALWRIDKDAKNN